MNRRAATVGAAAVTALATGVGWQQWHERSGLVGSPVAAKLPWTLRFPRIDGSELVMAQLIGRPLVLNFWATWCPPCIKEMPELDRFQRDFAARGWRVVGLAVDNAPAVREFLQRRPVRYDIALAGFDGVGVVRELGNAAGGLPFTVVFDAVGAVRQHKLGELTYAELATWAKQP